MTAIGLLAPFALPSFIHEAAAQEETQQCPITAPTLEGPFYRPVDLVRDDITDGRPGVPLNLRIQVVSAATCGPLAGVPVEIWQADAGGVYSGFGPSPTTDTFLRGTQLTGSDGTVQFTTIYPGWYPGRAPHIHFKVHLGNGRALTSQLFFDDRLSNAVYQQSPYNSRPGPRTMNSGDVVLNLSPGAVPTLLAPAQVIGDTIVATLLVGVID